MVTRRHLYSYTWGLWLKGFVLKAFVLDSGTWDVNTQNHIYIYIHMYMGFEDFGIQCSGGQPRGEGLGGNGRPITLSTSAKNLNRFRVQG